MITNPTITLVFVNFQSVWSLSLALESLFLQEPHKGFFEVIVFNNDVKERSALKQLSRLLPFRLIQSESNVGFGQGVNMATAQAQGTILGLLNPDTRWLRESLAEIGGFLNEQPKDTLLGLQLVNKSGMPETWSQGQAPTLALLLKNKLASFFGSSGKSGKRALDWVSGGGIFLSKKTFLDLGGFDKDFFLYFEDVDLCLRAKKCGGEVLCDSRFSLEHTGGKSFHSPVLQKAQYYTSQGMYFKKHRPRGEFLIVRLFHRIFKNI